jgi:hypothetical protein
MSRNTTHSGDAEGSGRAWGRLFPARPRSFPGRRAVKISLRAAHVLCAGVATGSYVFDVAEPLRGQWLLAAAATGVAMLLLDLHESGVFLFQARGVIVLAKIAVVGALPLIEPHRGWILAAMLLLSVVSSHAPSKLRYFVAIGKHRFKGAETKG